MKLDHRDISASEAAEEALGFAREVEQEFRCANHGDTQLFWQELLIMIERERRA